MPSLQLDLSADLGPDATTVPIGVAVQVREDMADRPALQQARCTHSVVAEDDAQPVSQRGAGRPFPGGCA